MAPMGITRGPITPNLEDDAAGHALSEAMALLAEVATICQRHPELDPDTVRHTLALLRLDPLTRLNSSLLRGRAAAIHRP
jgi:hypothetical protein